MALRFIAFSILLSITLCGTAQAGALSDMSGELTALVKAAASSVVEIRVSKDIAKRQLLVNLRGLGAQTPESFENKIPKGLAESVGSGFVIDADGSILTTADVVRDAERIIVKFPDGTFDLKAKVMGIDNLTGSAVIRVDRPGLKPLPLGDSSDLRPGALVVTINSQAGMVNSVSLGVVAGMNREMGSTVDTIQISGTIGPGASGGPVLDDAGRVVGMTFAMFSPTSSVLPFNYPNIIIGGGQTGIDLLRGLGEKGQRAAAQLGVTLKQAEVTKARANDAYRKQTLSPRAPGHPYYPQLKLKAVEAEADLQAAQGELDAATKALDLLKSAGGAFTVGQMPEFRIAEDLFQSATQTNRITGSTGFAIPINRIKSTLDDLREGKEIKHGYLGAAVDDKDGRIILKYITKDGPAAEAALEAGDVLVSADGKPFPSTSDFVSYLRSRKPGETLKLLVERDGKQVEVAVKLGKYPELDKTPPAATASPSSPKPPRRQSPLTLKGPLKVNIKPHLFGGKAGDLPEVSLDDAGIAEVAKAISDASGVSVIVKEPEKIRKKVSVHLKSTTVAKALDVICRTLGCTYKKDGDAYVISPK